MTMDLRQKKRYQLKAAATFSWKDRDGSTMQGQGYTRDISSSGVFVLTEQRLEAGTAVKMEVVLPSLRSEQSGASLRTQGQVVRSEEIGFAAVADLGFRIQLPESGSLEEFSWSGGSSKHGAKIEASGNHVVPVGHRTSRF
jgi:hypothetical protein